MKDVELAIPARVNTIVVVMDTTTLVLARLATKMIPPTMMTRRMKETEDLRKLSDEDFKHVAKRHWRKRTYDESVTHAV